MYSAGSTKSSSPCIYPIGTHLIGMMRRYLCTNQNRQGAVKAYTFAICYDVDSNGYLTNQTETTVLRSSRCELLRP
jgi:hypothetical protein